MFNDTIDSTTRTAATTSAPPRHRTPMMNSLDAEWRRLRQRPATLRRVRAWPTLVDDHAARRALDDTVSTVNDLTELVAATLPRHVIGRSERSPSAPDPDAVMAALVTIAAGDELAARVVLQRMLPGIIARSAKWSRSVVDGDRTDIAIGAAYLAIRRFDVTTRRSHIAAALVSDTIWAAFRRPSRRLERAELPTSSDMLARVPAPEAELDPLVALAGTIRAASRAGVDDVHLDLVRDLARHGTPTRLAQANEITTRTVRNRRDNAAASIRSALGPAWADWTDPLTNAA